MAIKKTSGTHVTIYKPSHIYAQIWDEDESKSNDIFDFEEVLRDTTSLSMDDNDTSDIENEVSDDPIKTLVNLGAFQFASTIEDIQSSLVVALCGFENMGTDDKPVVAAPAQYKELFATIVVVIPDEDGTKNVAFICPKVQLNSKLLIESLNSALTGINLAGTAKAQNVTFKTGTVKKTPLFIDYNYTLPTKGTEVLRIPSTNATTDSSGS